jgi:DNA invertase Pin-like site-specific DNA recombinase
MIVGYARCSSNDQNVEIQLAALKAAGCEKVFADKGLTGTNTERPEYKRMVEFVRDGDVIVVTRIDRLARSAADLLTLSKELQRKGVDLRATEQPVDTTTASGRCFFGMLGVFAQFETELRKERQLEGIAKAKAAGVYKGRPQTIDVAIVKQLAAEGMKKAEIAKKLNIGRASVYRVLEEAIA